MKLATVAGAVLAPIVIFAVVLAATYIGSVLWQGADVAETASRALQVVARSFSLGHAVLYAVVALPALLVPRLLGMDARGQRSAMRTILGWMGSIVLMSWLPVIICLVVFSVALVGVAVGLFAGTTAVLVCRLLSRGGPEGGPKTTGGRTIETPRPSGVPGVFGRRGA